MGNQITFSGSGELDNGMTVGLSFAIDEFDGANASEAANTGSVFDAHSVTVSSDALGKLVFHGEGGDSAQNAVGDTAAGNIWDNFDAATTTTQLSESGMSTNSMHYTLPSMVDGVAVSASYSPNKGQDEADTAYAVVYTGVEGLTVSYGKGSSDGDAAATANTTAANADTTSIKASYAYGPVTLAYSDHDHDSNTDTSDQTAKSMKISYTVSDAISVSYATEEIDSKASTTNVDAEYTKIATSYTSGGMTVSANYQEADNIDFSTSALQDKEYYGLSLSFAF